MEDASLGTKVGRVQAFDSDVGQNAVFEYAITRANIGKTLVSVEISYKLQIVDAKKEKKKERENEFALTKTWENFGKETSLLAKKRLEIRIA